jgi:hypothetical protein
MFYLESIETVNGAEILNLNRIYEQLSLGHQKNGWNSRWVEWQSLNNSWGDDQFLEKCIHKIEKNNRKVKKS